ncbi:hypothetical protein SKAU_G00000460 [Synaphobranchus kaupii]|uniref:Uncharacterized protein n=1 Tax=Synaphobranchus kaupii TaxID=118154 RepID=A0A9Q1G8Z1_SYNKA|nr:hypothetical protein SKAU_G00000460 [Synaphobranchus kaupii]
MSNLPVIAAFDWRTDRKEELATHPDAALVRALRSSHVCLAEFPVDKSTSIDSRETALWAGCFAEDDLPTRETGDGGSLEDTGSMAVVDIAVTHVISERSGH